MSYPFRVEFFDCDCYSHDHALRFTYDPTEDDIRMVDIWVDAHFPTNRTLWQRIVLAYKYITRTGSMDYTYGTWILKREDEGRLRNFFRDYDAHIRELEEAQKNGNQQKDGV